MPHLSNIPLIYFFLVLIVVLLLVKQLLFQIIYLSEFNKMKLKLSRIW